MAQSQSIAFRAILALALMIGFYVVALTIGIGLLYIPIAIAMYSHAFSLKILIICWIAGGSILFAIIPRVDRFVGPGPRLTESEQPRLFQEIQRVAAESQQAMPAEVYLVPDVNAFVTERGGVMGIGSRRVMGVGLSLLQVLTVAELRAVIAHEFGHFRKGDTKLGPWVYKTRSAIGRTLVALSQQSSVFQAPFIWYGKMFMRVAQSVSRAQEFVADEVAAQVAGAQHLISGLRRITQASFAFSSYWQEAVAPAIDTGFAPPIADGLKQFIQAPQIAKELENVVSTVKGRSNPYDSHPSLQARIDALSKLSLTSPSTDDRPAISLLDDIPKLETQMLGVIIGEEESRRLRKIEWKEVGSQVYVKIWKRQYRELGAALTRTTPLHLGPALRKPKAIISKLHTGEAQYWSQELRESYPEILAGVAISLCLIERGWSVEVNFGEPVKFTCNDNECLPFESMAKLVSDATNDAPWAEFCKGAGIAEVDLGKIEVREDS